MIRAPARPEGEPARYRDGMHPFDEMKAYVRFDETDAARLAALWDAIGHDMPATVDRFYAEILAAPRARAVLADEAQVEQLRRTLLKWIEELLRGPHDVAYYERRQRIGRVHVLVDLPSRFMFTAMSVVRRELFAKAGAAGFDSATRDSIEKVTTLDLAIMTGTYIEGRERVEATTVQELILSHMPVTILLVDREGRISAATRPGTRLFGGADLMGRAVAEAFPPALVAEARLEEQLARALHTGRQITLTRIDVELDGAPRSFRLTLVPLGHVLGAALIHVEELTEAVSTEARLRRSEALAILGTFSAAVAHELRNPLAGMRGALQVITETFPADDPRRAVMKKVEHQIVRLNELITDLLQFARPPEAHPDFLSLGASVRTAVEAVRGAHPAARIEVRGEGDAYADDQLVHRTLINLIENAAQATQDEGRILVVVGPGRVLVNDDGPGIPVELRERVFQPFFTTRTSGTGLGLAICAQAALSMNGSVLLGQGPLPGAAFVLTLPVAG